MLHNKGKDKTENLSLQFNITSPQSHNAKTWQWFNFL